jgi:hypothetical protein
MQLHPENKKLWLSIALPGKLLLLWFISRQVDLPDPKTGLWMSISGDAVYYLWATENIVQYGIYNIHSVNPQNYEPYAGRMPGYEALMAPLRLLFSQSTVIHITGILQLMLDAIAAYCLALTARRLFNADRIFYFVFFGYLISSYVSVFDLIILTESLAVSFLIFSFYFLLRYKSSWDYVWSSSFLTWSIFLRPYLFPVLVLFAIFILYEKVEKNRQSTAKNVATLLMFLSPFLLADGAWIVRNYVFQNKFIPLVNDLYAGYKFPPRQIALYEFVKSWGGDGVYWNPGAEITLFIDNDATARVTKKYNTIQDLPDYIFTSTYNADSLRKVKEYYSQAEKLKQDNTLYDRWLVTNLKQYREDFIEEKPFHYYIVAPLILLQKYLFHSGTYNLSNTPFDKQNIIQKVYKLFYTALYGVVLMNGFAGIIWVLYKNRIASVWLWAAIPLYITLLGPVVLRAIEYRYFVAAYPFLLVLGCYFIVQIWENLLQLKRSR